MRENYKECLAAVLKYEGGYVNHPKDPGGATMKGVTQGTYNAWRKQQGLPSRPVKQIEQSEIEAIYRNGYWDVVKGDELPSGLDLAVFDYAVNSGPGRAIRHLQAVLGVPQTGSMNQATLEAAKKNSGAWAQLCDKRLGFLKRLGTWTTFGKGWGARVADVRKRSSELASRGPKSTTVSSAAPKIDVAAAQRRLAELNYPLGSADGINGPLTRSAIRDFQDANNIPINGRLDDRTYSALMGSNPVARPVSSARAALTLDDLKKSGSSVISSAEDIKSSVTTATGAVAAASGFATQVQDHVQTAKDATGTLAWFFSDWRYIVLAVLVAVAVFAIWRVWRNACKVEELRLEDARSGRNVRI